MKRSKTERIKYNDNHIMCLMLGHHLHKAKWIELKEEIDNCIIIAGYDINI